MIHWSGSQSLAAGVIGEAACCALVATFCQRRRRSAPEKTISTVVTTPLIPTGTAALYCDVLRCLRLACC